MNINYKENGRKKGFLASPKHQYHVFQYGEHDCGTQSEKEYRLLWESKLDSLEGQTLIIGKIMEKKLFLQIESINRVSQCGERDYSAQSHKECELLWVSKFDSFYG